MRWQQDAVERLVAPLPLREAEKERLREELWGHLADCYREELGRTRDLDAAKSAACARLGNSDALAREYAHWATPVERIESGLIRALSADARSRANRVFAASTVLLAAVSFVTLPLPGMSPASAFMTWLTCSLLAFVASATWPQAARSFQQQEVSARRFIQHAASCIAAVFVAEVLALAVYTTTNHTEMLTVFHDFLRHVYGPLALLAVIGAPPLAHLATRYEHKSRTLPNWPYPNP